MDTKPSTLALLGPDTSTRNGTLRLDWGRRLSGGMARSGTPGRRRRFGTSLTSNGLGTTPFKLGGRVSHGSTTTTEEPGDMKRLSAPESRFQ